MRSGEGNSQRAKRRETLSRAPAAMLFALLAVTFDAASAQMPGTSPEEPKPAKSAAPPSALAKDERPTTPASLAPSEELPWLATTTAQPDATPKPPPSPQPPVTTPKTTIQTGDKKTASAAKKCEEQQEEGCRALKSCAWVAAMPALDGKITPARCAERIVYAPEKEKKPKAAAAKPKPKPEKAAVPPVAATEPVKPQPEAKAQAQPEPQSPAEPVTAAIPTVQSPPAAAIVPPATAPAAPTTPAKQPSTAEIAAPSEAAVSPAATPPTLLSRGAVPFLPSPSAKADAPADPPQLEAVSEAMVEEEEQPSTSDELPLSIPGLVIAD
jgi:hypothetical protein